VAFVQAANPNAIGNGLEETINGLKKEQKGSPGRSMNKLGALYNPNYVDPRILPQHNSPHGPAGIKTNFGVVNIMDNAKKHYEATNPYSQNRRFDDDFILAQGSGTGTFVPSHGIGKMKTNKGYQFRGESMPQNRMSKLENNMQGGGLHNSGDP
jgi:hypothetical protein